VSESQYEHLMAAALREAHKALAVDEVPIGAVVADAEGRILAAAHNRRHVDRDPTAHAEMLAIRTAAATLGDWRLAGCTLAVTLEPCCMCAGAIVLSRIETLIYGAADPKAGAVETLYTLCNDERLNHRVNVVSGVQADECSRLLSEFFQAQRAKGKK
jgi:tRNA(adenine34) deaminase